MIVRTQVKRRRLTTNSVQHKVHHQNSEQCHTNAISRVGVTKAPFVNFSISKTLDLAKLPAGLFESNSYLTGVTAAELRRHLSNMNMIFKR